MNIVYLGPNNNNNNNKSIYIAPNQSRLLSGAPTQRYIKIVKVSSFFLLFLLLQGILTSPHNAFIASTPPHKAFTASTPTHVVTRHLLTLESLCQLPFTRGIYCVNSPHKAFTASTPLTRHLLRKLPLFII